LFGWDGEPMKPIYLIGAGGHCRSCIDVIEATGSYEIKGLFDIKENVNKKIGQYKIIDTDDNLDRYVDEDSEFLIALGQIKSSEKRQQIANKLYELGARLATVVSPLAYVAKTAIIGPGTIVMHHSLVNAYAQISSHCILNTKSLVEHDAKIEDFCHISTGAVVNGGAHLKQGSFVGSLAIVKEGYAGQVNAVLSAGVFHR